MQRVRTEPERKQLDHYIDTGEWVELAEPEDEPATQSDAPTRQKVDTSGTTLRADGKPNWWIDDPHEALESARSVYQKSVN